MSALGSSPTAHAKCTVPFGPTASEGPLAGRASLPATCRVSEKLCPASAERLTLSLPSYSVQATNSSPPGPRAISRLPLCQRSRVSRPLPQPAVVFDRFKGSLKVLPSSSDRAKKTSPPCDPPENTISCHDTNSSPSSP